MGTTSRKDCLDVMFHHTWKLAALPARTATLPARTPALPPSLSRSDARSRSTMVHGPARERVKAAVLYKGWPICRRCTPQRAGQRSVSRLMNYAAESGRRALHKINCQTVKLSATQNPCSAGVTVQDDGLGR